MTPIARWVDGLPRPSRSLGRSCSTLPARHEELDVVDDSLAFRVGQGANAVAADNLDDPEPLAFELGAETLPLDSPQALEQLDERDPGRIRRCENEVSTKIGKRRSLRCRRAAAPRVGYVLEARPVATAGPTSRSSGRRRPIVGRDPPRAATATTWLAERLFLNRGVSEREGTNMTMSRGIVSAIVVVVFPGLLMMTMIGVADGGISQTPGALLEVAALVVPMWLLWFAAIAWVIRADPRGAMTTDLRWGLCPEVDPSGLRCRHRVGHSGSHVPEDPVL